MSSYSLKCKKIQKTNPSVSKTSNGKAMLLPKCGICGTKKSKFIKTQESSGILSGLDLKTPFSKIPLFGDILFECNSIERFCSLSKIILI